jgi:peptidoglycan-associated lipoprotein
MRLQRSRVLALSVCVAAFGLAACGQSPTSQTSQSDSSMGTSETSGAMPSMAAMTGSSSSLKPVHFNLDDHKLRPGAMKVLDENARYLKSRPDMTVEITGHADERGTEAYNIALSDRRAQATMSALVARGVDAKRITTNSYGESRPLCTDSHEGCWSKNRRAEFMVKGQ